MLTWLIQPVKIEAEKIQSLIEMLDKADIDYEIVFPLNGEILTSNKEKWIYDINKQYFVCGSYPLTRLMTTIQPSSVFSLERYSFEKLWTIFGKNNFVNDDAIISHSENIVWLEEEYFVRPLEDTKSFNGGVYNKNTLHFKGMVLYSSLKHISREYRFFVIDGKIITASLYKVNGRLEQSSIIDDGALHFAQHMISKFNYPGYVIDIATVNNNHKIMELNCFNASGFYDINLYKYIMAIEDYYLKYF